MTLPADGWAGALAWVWVWAVGGLVLGAIIGSFLATIVVRWPRGESAVAGRSHCDGCGRTLTAIELVPILSALVQRGRCRTCGAAIDRDHLAIELAAAAIGAASFGLAPGLAGVGWAVFGWLLLTLAALDVRHFWLPDRLTAPLAGLGLAFGGVTAGTWPIDRLIGAIVGFGCLWAIGAAYRRLRGREGLGLGDAKLLGAIGAWLGWLALPFVLLAGSVIGLIAAALSGGMARDRPIPFGAALAAGAIPGWLALRVMSG